MTVLACRVCGEEFVRKGRNVGQAVTCSAGCRQQYRKRERKRLYAKYYKPRTTVLACCICGTKFVRKGRAMTCSTACREYRRCEYKRERRRRKHYHRAVVACRVCGSEFASGTKALTCSKVCREQYYRVGKRRYRTEHREEIRKYALLYRSTHSEEIRESRLQYNADRRVALACHVCGTEFVRRTTTVTCSMACRQQHERKRNSKNMRQYYDSHREEMLERISRYQAAHPEMVRNNRRTYEIKCRAAVEVYRQLNGPLRLKDGPAVLRALKELPALLRAHFDLPVKGGRP